MSKRSFGVWRALRWALISLAALITFAALFGVGENLRGKRAWEAYKRQMGAQGQSLDGAQWVPPRVPDDENFAMTPFLAPLFDFEPGTQKPRNPAAVDRLKNFATEVEPRGSASDRVWDKGGSMDLVEWANRLQDPTKKTMTVKSAPLDRVQAAAAVLLALKQYGPQLEEIQAASQRPHSRFNVAYDNEIKVNILLPHLSVLNRLCQVLRLRASAEMVLGQRSEALLDLNLILFLADSVNSEPCVISQLVRIACFKRAFHVIEEALDGHYWSDAQLAALQQHLQRFDFLKDGLRTLRSERDFLGNSLFEALRSGALRTGDVFGMGGNEAGIGWDDQAFGGVVDRLVPRGWIYFEQLNYHRLFTYQIVLHAESRHIDPQSLEDREASLRQKLAPDQLSGISDFAIHHRLFSRVMLPGLSKCQRKMVRGQSAADLAVVGCALERHRLAEGRYPEGLDALVPRFIANVPQDVIMGQPLKYRRTEDGQFLLYSIGWNKKDDGGEGIPKHDSEEGDWVWKGPASH